MKDDSLSQDKLILSKASDTIYLSQKRCAPCFYGFLDERQAELIKDTIFTDDCMFWGGFADAQRVFFGCNVCDTEQFPITSLKFTYKKEFKLSHRDFLGALMSLGIERSTIGDILTFEGYSYVFVKTELADYIRCEITKIGRVGVKIESADLSALNFTYDFNVLNFTVSSLRLDVLVSALCSLSREKSQKLIKSDLVSVNYKVVNNVSLVLKAGDIITIRKYGKFVFTDECGFSKKGKVRISVKHFR